MSSRDALTIAAAQLAESAPRAYAKLCEALKNYADTCRDDCVQSPLEVLQLNQGRAQATIMLESLFRNAVADADRMTKRRST